MTSCHILFVLSGWFIYISGHWPSGSPIARETWVQSQVESYQRLKKWYLMPPCLTLSIIGYGSRVKWSNPGKGVAPSPTPWCSKLSKREPSGHPRLSSPTLLIYIYIYISMISSQRPKTVGVGYSRTGVAQNNGKAKNLSITHIKPLKVYFYVSEMILTLKIHRRWFLLLKCIGKDFY